MPYESHTYVFQPNETLGVSIQKLNDNTPNNRYVQISTFTLHMTPEQLVTLRDAITTHLYGYPAVAQIHTVDEDELPVPLAAEQGADPGVQVKQGLAAWDAMAQAELAAAPREEIVDDDKPF
jgi:hypothetical protein